MLGDLFVPHLRGATVGDPDALEVELGRAIGRARAAWPTVRLDSEAFVPELAARLPESGEALDGLRALRVEDLYLACACARGDATAIAALETACFHQIDAALAQLRIDSARADELKQRLRERLFTGAERTPRIAEYGGRGNLGRWLRAVAIRAGLDELRRGGRELPSGDGSFADRAVPMDDPELLLLKARYAADFRAAVRDAMTELEPAARNDLRLYYLEGLTLEDLAALHRVAVATVWRRLGRARAAVLEATRRILRERLGVSDADVESILGLISSRLELSKSALAD